MCGMNSQFSRRRRGRFNRFLALAAFSSAMLTGTAGINSAFAQTAMPVSANAIQVAGHAGPTPAWIAFCAQMPEECAYDASEPARIVLDQTTWKAIVEINERVNDTIIPVTDQDHWGVADRWDYPDDGLGDCEDIQLLKRRMLTGEGPAAPGPAHDGRDRRAGSGARRPHGQDRSRRFHSRQQAQGRSALAGDGLSLCEAGRLEQCSPGSGSATRPRRS